jgi:hypothetical protein
MSLLEESVPVWERAELLARQFSSPQTIGLFHGLRTAFRHKEDVFVIVDQTTELEKVTHMIETRCKAWHVHCTVVTSDPKLEVMGKQNLFPRLAPNVRLLIAQVSSTQPLRALVSEFYWVIAHYQPRSKTPTLQAGMMSPSRPTKSSLELNALSLVKELNSGSLLFSMNGEWVEVLATDSLQDVITKAPDFVPLQTVADLVRRLARAFYNLSIRFQTVVDNPHTGILPEGINFDEEGKPIIDAEQLLRGY